MTATILAYGPFWLLLTVAIFVLWVVHSVRSVNRRRDAGRLSQAAAARSLYDAPRAVDRVPPDAQRSRGHVTGDRP
jgi:hypothetical protein